MKKRSHKKKLLIILSTTIVLSLLVLIYKVDILKWSCENETVGPSCMIVATHYEEKLELENAVKYYEMACEYKYALGCKTYSFFLERQGNEEKAKIFSDKACSLGGEQICNLKESDIDK